MYRQVAILCCRCQPHPFDIKAYSLQGLEFCLIHSENLDYAARMFYISTCQKNKDWLRFLSKIQAPFAWLPFHCDLSLLVADLSCHLSLQDEELLDQLEPFQLCFQPRR